MPPRDARALLADIAEACEHLREVTIKRSVDDYADDWKLRAIVERQFITIGEAVGSLLKLDQSYGERITHSRQIIGFRNILVHGYALVDHRTTWGVIESDVQRLAAEVSHLMREYNS